MEEFDNEMPVGNEQDEPIAEENFASEDEIFIQDNQIEETDQNTVNGNEIPSDEEKAEDGNGYDTLQDKNSLNKIEYPPVYPINDYKPASKGLKIFAVIVASVILLTGASAAGYFFGKNSVSSNRTGASVNVDLASKPKNKDENTAEQVYSIINKSVVGIRIYNSSGSAAEASGVIYSEDGYVVTNDHIYAEIGEPNFRIYMYDGKEYDAKYIAGDSISDLSVLKIESKDKFAVPQFGNSNELVCGQSVVAVGRPNSAVDNSSITGGIISLTKRRVKTTSNYTESLIQTDSAINPGSSGGALVNMYGQVVGITSSKLAGVEYDSIGYAIPTVTMKRVVEQLIKDGKVTDRAKLGITYTELNSVIAKVNGYDNVGLYVSSVSEDSDIYGKVTEGDIITHVNGKEITNDDIILDIIEESKAGDSITLTVVSKKGKTSEYKVKLKANVGESSYSSTIKEKENSQSGGNSSGGTFDFPFGE